MDPIVIDSDATPQKNPSVNVTKVFTAHTTSLIVSDYGPF